MYFCNEGYCPTQSNPNTTCTPDGTQHNIKIRKEETGSSMEIIDTVTSSPLNGWIKHQVDFTTITPGYKIYFDFEKTSGPATPMTTIAVDEISIHQGNCFDEPVTQNITTTLTESMVTMTTDIEIKTSTAKASTVSTKITSTIEQSTEFTIINLNNSMASTELVTYVTNSNSPVTLTTITTSTSDNQSTESNNIYIIVLAVVIPIVLSSITAIVIWIIKCYPKKKISPSALELNQVPT
ncbi:unnamed protein product [Rotaria sp. Silwood1]|nr:unnamed protein product [Rotaria sp. Silwood1]CAF4949207.1 unnamed protein product [Rotaria sp. Silwood1]